MIKRKNILKIAIDSPAAAGAGTVAKAISKHYNLFYLDTGKIYRFIAYLKIKFPKKFNNKFIKSKIKSLKMKNLADNNLLSDEVGTKASIISKSKSIRKIVHSFQINFAYNGNACRDILNKKLDDMKTAVPDELKKYVTVLERLKNVKDACFSYHLDPNFKQIIADFEQAWDNIMNEKYPKAHILTTHVPMFCEKERRGLGIVSEQTSEAIHKGYTAVYKNYKRFQDGHYRAVFKYNSKHL